MKFLLKQSLWVLLLPFLLSACTAYKKTPYLTNIDEFSTSELANNIYKYEAVIMPKDILTITVNTPTNIASKDFNLPIIPQEGNDVLQTKVSSTSGGYGTLQNYIVDNNGYINFPVLGKLKIGGMKRTDAEKLIYSMVYPQYLKEEPIVNIRFLNYKVAVLGEVAKPGVYTTVNEQMTIFDALALAGDLTIYGRRDNVLLIRENANGGKSSYRINLQDTNTILNNTTYYLQQNDKIYIEPNKTRSNSSQIGALESISISVLSLIITVVSVITR